MSWAFPRHSRRGDRHDMKVSKACSVEPLGHGRPGRIQVLMAMEGADGLRTIDDLAMVHEFGVQMIGLAGPRGGSGQWAAGNRRPGGCWRAMGRQIVAREWTSSSSSMMYRTWPSRRSGHSWVPAARAHSGITQYLPGFTGKIAPAMSAILTDQQIKAAPPPCGGMIGLNLCCPLPRHRTPATIADAVHHILHIMDVAGPQRLRQPRLRHGRHAHRRRSAPGPRPSQKPRAPGRSSQTPPAADDDVRGFTGG